MHYITTVPSPVGLLTLASDGEHLTGLWIENQKYFAAGLSNMPERKDDLPVFCTARNWLARYCSGNQPYIAELPLIPEGSEFRRLAWDLLCQIPYGTLTTYGELGAQIARRLGRPSMSGQAVGGAIGHNPISIIIPCHRVVGSGGSLTGYAGGLDVKIRLLELEGVDMSRLTVPKKGAAL